MGKNNSTGTICIFAKIPGNGTAKTRIAKTEGAEKAAEIYQELLAITADIVAEFPYHVAYSDSTDYKPLKKTFKRSNSFFAQTGETLGDRLANSFTYLFNTGYSHICAIGTDCPTLSPHDITQAFFLLEHGFDTVIGPAHDGGYYLIACNRNSLDIFSATQWSSPSLLDETVEILESGSLRYRLLKPRFDIDHMEDYLQWKKENK